MISNMSSLIRWHHSMTWPYSAWHIPLADGLEQVKLPVGQVDLSTFFFWITYNLLWKMQFFAIRQMKIFWYVKPWSYTKSVCVNGSLYLCCLVTPYGNKDLSEHRLMISSHYLNEYSSLISVHSLESSFTVSIQATILFNEFENDIHLI